jgi:protocatechuate 3,4-dioxygenase, alpha subunit
MSEVPTASQTVGPFFSIGLSHLYARESNTGQAGKPSVTVRGRVLDGDGVGVPDAVLEIWQHSMRAPNSEKSGFLRVPTNQSGGFEFAVEKRKTARDESGATHAPHAVVLIFMRGLVKHLVTRIYFAGEAANAEDVVLQSVPQERRATLLATDVGAKNFVEWNVHLQGKQETVFFEA